MRVDCEGCAGCCLDWRPLVSAPSDHEREGGREPLDDRYNLPTLRGEEVRAFLEAGYGDALTVRLFSPNEDDDAVRIDGHDLAAVRGRPAFVVGLRAVPKPVAPFGTDGGESAGTDGGESAGTDGGESAGTDGGESDAETDRRARGEAPDRTWLPTCVFLDPESLQCRIHGDDIYPETCATYPGTNLRLDRETECERVEDAFGRARLLDDEPPPDAPNPFAPGALGGSVFAHPSPDALEGVVAGVVEDDPGPAELAPFLGVAAGSAPGTLAVDEERRGWAESTVRSSDSWVGDAVADWLDRAGEPGSPVTGTCDDHDEANGAPGTPGWDGLEE